MKVVNPLTITDAVLASSNVPETDYTAWSSGATYAAEDRVRVVSTNVHKVFESAQGGNTNHDPLTDDGTWWLEVGATNRWSMFDTRVSSQTTNPDSVEVELDLVGRVDTLSLLNVRASSVDVVMTSAGGEEVFNETFELLSNAAVVDWYTYFFEPIERVTDLIVSVPVYNDATLEVSLVEVGQTVAVGVLAVGLSRSLGGTRWSPNIGIQDYSVKERNDWGDYVVVERAFNKRGSFSVWMDTPTISSIQNLLASLRTTPVVWIGDDDIGATVMMGFYREFAIEIAYPNKSLLSLEIEGLT